MYFIYWISVCWSWKLSWGVLENFQWDLSKMDIHIFFPRRFVEGRGEGAEFWGFAYHHQYNYWIQVNHVKVFLLSFFSGVEEAMIYKHHQWWLLVVPRVTKDHWFNPSHFSYLPQEIRCIRVVPRDNKAHLVHPLQFFTGYKAIISRDSYQGSLRPIGLIPQNKSCWPQGDRLKRVVPRGTKDHWVYHFRFLLYERQ